LCVGAFGVLIERSMLHWLYKLDHLYGLLLTFGLALVVQGLFQNEYGSSGLPYAIPAQLQGGQNLGFMFLPNYRAWVIVPWVGKPTDAAVEAEKATMLGWLGPVVIAGALGEALEAIGC
jgi:hypothetical protein